MDPPTLHLSEGIAAGRRACLARGITLVESSHPAKAEQARLLVNRLTSVSRERAEAAGRACLSFRLGLSGPPGAGKSTFTEALGKLLTAAGHRVAVLAVDPSSGTTGGSLLGDKTRMPELTIDPSAFIRPSPARGHLGGVTRTTNEAVILCEAAGYDLVLVETVGVGQSEYLVRDMVDMFCLILPPAGGDELQGIKRGIVEQSDLIIVNKCDGDLVPAARRVAYEYMSALKYMRPRCDLWRPRVKLCSSLPPHQGLGEVWAEMEKYRAALEDAGELGSRRAEQHRRWMWSYVEERLVRLAREEAGRGGGAGYRLLEDQVAMGALCPGAAADTVIQRFLHGRQGV
jgi:LAO/AO transport system kinase